MMAPYWLTICGGGAILAASSFVACADDTVRAVDAVASLRAAAGSTDGAVTLTRGYFGPGKPGAASYIWRAAATEPDDGCRAIQPTSIAGPGRWLLNPAQGVAISPATCGALPGGDDPGGRNAAAIEAALRYASGASGVTFGGTVDGGGLFFGVSSPVVALTGTRLQNMRLIAVEPQWQPTTAVIEIPRPVYNFETDRILVDAGAKPSADHGCGGVTGIWGIANYATAGIRFLNTSVARWCGTEGAPGSGGGLYERGDAHIVSSSFIQWSSPGDGPHTGSGLFFPSGAADSTVIDSVIAFGEHPVHIAPGAHHLLFVNNHVYNGNGNRRPRPTNPALVYNAGYAILWNGGYLDNGQIIVNVNKLTPRSIAGGPSASMVLLGDIHLDNVNLTAYVQLTTDQPNSNIDDFKIGTARFVGARATVPLVAFATTGAGSWDASRVDISALSTVRDDLVTTRSGLNLYGGFNLLHGGFALRGRSIATTGPIDLTAADSYVGIDATAASDRTLIIRLPPVANLTQGQIFLIKDEGGTATSNNFEILPPSGTIDGRRAIRIERNFGWAAIRWSGKVFSQVE